MVAPTEKVLIHNILVAHKKSDLKHQTANLNALAHYCGLKSPKIACYILFEGHTPGLYSKWEDIVLNTKNYKDAEYKKHNSLEEGFKVAQTCFGQTFCPTLRGKVQPTSSDL